MQLEDRNSYSGFFSFSIPKILEYEIFYENNTKNIKQEKFGIYFQIGLRSYILTLYIFSRAFSKFRI